MLGYTEMGSGRQTVIVLNDWLGDTGSWDGARPYLNLARRRWIFADLRGYGASRALSGEYTAEEAAADVEELAAHLGLTQCAIVGHSMSSLVVLALLARARLGIECAVLLTPPPPNGMHLPEPVRAFLRAMAEGDDSLRAAAFAGPLGERLSADWATFKIERWRESADSAAVSAYVAMFAGAFTPPQRIDVPLLVVAGECDAEPMRSAPLQAAYGALCSDLQVEALTQCGHYPMQEMPVLLTTLVQRFLDKAY